jgi:hypothetical protein
VKEGRKEDGRLTDGEGRKMGDGRKVKEGSEESEGR